MGTYRYQLLRYCCALSAVSYWASVRRCQVSGYPAGIFISLVQVAQDRSELSELHRDGRAPHSALLRTAFRKIPTHFLPSLAHVS